MEEKANAIRLLYSINPNCEPFIWGNNIELAANGIIHPDTYSFKALEDYSTYVCLGHIRHPFSVDKCLGHGFIHKHHPIETEFTCEYDGTHQHLIILHGKVMDKESGLVLNSGERTPIDLDKPRFFITQENTHIAMV